MKRLRSLLLAGLLVFSMVLPSFAIADAPETAAKAVLVMDRTSGKILYDKNIDKMMNPASTTKMMTAILAIENLNMDDMLTADEEVSKTRGTRVGFYVGDQITVRDALYGLMTASYNDCATLLAKAVAGSVSSFANMMNARAQEIGASSTTYVNPHGLTAEGHMTTARDLATIANHCLNNETFRDLICQGTYTFNIYGDHARTVTATTTNKLLYDETGAYHYEGIYGVKTGETSAAGACLVAACKRGDTDILTVVLKATGDERFDDTMALMDWAFNNFQTVTPFKDAEIKNVQVKGGEVRSVPVEITSINSYTIGMSDEITTDIRVMSKVTAPISKGVRVGQALIYKNGKVLEAFDVVTSQDVKKGTFLSTFGIEDSIALKIYKVIKIILLIILILFILLAARIYYVYKKRQARRKKAEEKEEKSFRSAGKQK